MVRTRRDDDRIPIVSREFLFPVEDGLGFSHLDAEELIDVGVHLVAHLLAWLQVHHCKLGMPAGEQYPTEESVLPSLFFNNPA